MEIYEADKRKRPIISVFNRMLPGIPTYTGKRIIVPSAAFTISRRDLPDLHLKKKLFPNVFTVYRYVSVINILTLIAVSGNDL